VNKSKVAIIHHPDIEKSLEAALSYLNLSDLFTDKHVAIKPHDACAHPDEISACTQADTLRALIGLIKRHKPYRITVAGGSNNILETNHVFELLGIHDVISEEKVEYIDLNRGPFKRTKLNWGPAEEIVINNDRNRRRNL